jgi:small GTP-binding protein
MFLCLAWSPDGQILASATVEYSIRIWNIKTGAIISTVEGHTNPVTSISFSHDGRILASKSDDSVRLWRCDTWVVIATLDEKGFSGLISPPPSLAFHQKAPLLATLDEGNTVIRIWELDFDTLLRAAPTSSSVHYTNAKVVLVGDTGVGKSGLGLVLAGEPFAPTESTHGRRVWKFDNQQVEFDNSRKELRETLLWDLAGQPGYRLIHQLHLNEVAGALVVFDSRSETDPFAGVHYWDRALQQAQRIQGELAPTMKKFLVAARTDRGGISVSRTRIDSLVKELSFDGYFETSAKEGENIKELAEAIRGGIDWETLPKVSSTQLFQGIKEFLIEEKETGRLLSTADDLYSTFLKSKNAPKETKELYAQFETCIRLVESRDLIKRLRACLEI